VRAGYRRHGDPHGVRLVAALAGAATVCSCENVTKQSICTAIASGGLTDVGTVKAATRAGTWPACGWRTATGE